MKTFLERGGAWVAGQFLLFAALIARALTYQGEGPVAWTAAGVGALIAATAIAVAGAMVLGRHLTPFPKPCDHTELVQHRIYAKIRHPLYTAVILAGFAWALLWLRWPAAVVETTLIPFFHAKSCREERKLRQNFPEYRGYGTRTNRFIPTVH